MFRSIDRKLIALPSGKNLQNIDPEELFRAAVHSCDVDDQIRRRILKALDPTSVQLLSIPTVPPEIPGSSGRWSLHPFVISGVLIVNIGPTAWMMRNLKHGKEVMFIAPGVTITAGVQYFEETGRLLLAIFSRSTPGRAKLGTDAPTVLTVSVHELLLSPLSSFGYSGVTSSKVLPEYPIAGGACIIIQEPTVAVSLNDLLCVHNWRNGLQFRAWLHFGWMSHRIDVSHLLLLNPDHC